MGANFIRLGHHQQSGIILRLCDELGLRLGRNTLVPRRSGRRESYKNQARRMLTNMIEQHRNHPSVIPVGLGNENDWPGDFQTFEKTAYAPLWANATILPIALDPTRSTAIRRCSSAKTLWTFTPHHLGGLVCRRFRNYREMETAGINATTRFLHAEWEATAMPGAIWK